MLISQLEQYWEINHERIEQELRMGNYQPGIIKIFDVVNGHGKCRSIANMNVIDRFISRLLAQ